MFNFKFIFFTGLSLYLALSACAETKTIAFAQDTMGNDFRKAQVYEVRDALSNYPELKFVSSDAKGQTSLLVHHIDGFIASKADVIIVGTNDEKAVVPVIAKAYKNGIPIIILDRGIVGNDYTTFINSDNIKIGKIGAEYIAKRLGGKGKVLLFEGLLKADVTKLRTKGFMDEMANYRGISVIKRTGNYLRKDAIIEMEKLIESGEKIDAIFAESDSMVSGARSALEHHGIDPSSMITVGCDYTSEARDAIRKGKQTASVLFPLGGEKSAQIAIKILNGEKVPKHIIIPVKLITKENVDKERPIF
ncbi:substrate-binding domain-containing protein [Sulfuricurvum sp.]|uniref:substrate-binding domain-containing protein n=1 Tax=Sulfuricurvum sp. TaxID=2025608 RepID=UPI002604D3CD|nr:substrate-binding domain-containing protein [Sulfuricurvum sp.]MDD2780740.1 substrate-binding domain-containing protein [Sulfuricurvum sp.]